VSFGSNSPANRSRRASEEGVIPFVETFVEVRNFDKVDDKGFDKGFKVGILQHCATYSSSSRIPDMRLVGQPARSQPLTNGSNSPSMTACTLLVSTPVRRSLTIRYG